MAKPNHEIVKTADAVNLSTYEVDYEYSIECLTEGGCGGYTECFEDHIEGVYDGEYAQVIHGQVHTLINDAWTLPYKGCPVKLADGEVPYRILDRDTPAGRYPVLAVWDDYQVTLEEQGNG